MALAIIEADGFDTVEAGERPGQTDSGILPAGKQHQGFLPEFLSWRRCLNAFPPKTHPDGRSIVDWSRNVRDYAAPLPKFSAQRPVFQSMPFALHPLYVLSGFAVGFLVGMTGRRRRRADDAALILLFHVHPTTAVGTDLLYASITKSCGTVVHGFARNIDWRIVGRLALGSIPARSSPWPLSTSSRWIRRR